MRTLPKDDDLPHFGFFKPEGEDPRAKLTYVICDVPWEWSIVSRDGEIQPIPVELAEFYTPAMWRSLAIRILKTQLKACDRQQLPVQRLKDALRRVQQGDVSARVAASALPSAPYTAATRTDPTAFTASQLKLARKQRGMTQVDAANSLNRSQSYLSKCESGKHQLSKDEIARFAALYGQSEQYFVLGSDPGK